MKKIRKYLLGGALYGAAKAFGANDKTANIIGAAGGGAEMFFNPISGGADVAKYGASFLNNAGVITPEAANAVGQVSSIGSKFVPSMMAYGGSRKKICAYGGDLFNEYNGPQHEEGGIQISPVAETEGGENEYKGYIHSNRVKFDKSRTYADEASRIFSKYKKRLTDKLALESLDREMKALEMHQEANPEIQKGRAALEQEYGFGGPKKPPTAQDSLALHSLGEQGMMLYNQGLQTPEDYVTLRNNHAQADSIMRATGIEPIGEMPKKYWELNGQTDPSIPSDTQKIGYSQYIFAKPGQKAYGGKKYAYGNPPFDYSGAGQYGSPLLLGYENNPSLSLQVPNGAYDSTSADPSQIHTYANNWKNPISSKPASFQPTTPQLKQGRTINSYPSQSFNNQLPDSNIPITGALLNSIGPAAQLAGTLFQGADKTQFDRVNPQYVDYDPAIELAKNSYMGARGNMRAGITNNARSSGQLLSNMVSGDVALGRNFSNQVGELKMNEANTNAGITNQARSTNAQIQMQERIANEQNKAAYRQAIYGSLTDLGNIGGGYVKDNALLDAQTLQNQRTLNMLSGLPSRYTIDANGNIITK